MTLAEQLRSEVNNSISNEFKTKLLNIAMSWIRGSGEFSMVCDDHIRELKVYAAPLKYDEAICSIFSNEGFKVRHSRCCGVRHIDVTL